MVSRCGSHWHGFASLGQSATSAVARRGVWGGAGQSGPTEEAEEENCKDQDRGAGPISGTKRKTGSAGGRQCEEQEEATPHAIRANDVWRRAHGQVPGSLSRRPTRIKSFSTPSRRA